MEKTLRREREENGTDLCNTKLMSCRFHYKPEWVNSGIEKRGLSSAWQIIDAKLGARQQVGRSVRHFRT
jgi:hypothetical protein